MENRREFLATSLMGTAMLTATPAMAKQTLAFPKDFIWGTATASYQIEGAAKEDGRGESIWDRFSHTPGKVKNGDTGDIACDSYHRYPEDIAIMKQLHQKSCRFSVAWPRVIPGGTGAVNTKGLDFYKRYVDALLEAGIRPSCTLYHWDLPQVLQDKGGWTNRDMAGWFTDYAETVVKALSDRVTAYAIFNEPYVFTYLGYFLGVHAPGYKDFDLFLKAAHVTNLAQGDAFRTIKAIRPSAQVGGAYSMSPGEPETDKPEDIAAAERFDQINNLYFLDPALKGAYPKDVALLERSGFQPGDEVRMKAPLDWIGINYYFRQKVRANPQNQPYGFESYIPKEGPQTAFNWEVWPQGLYDIVMRTAKAYDLPIEITENGCSYPDAPGPDGRVRDDRRTAYFEGHLKALLRTIQDGAKVRGYHAWSLLDNFEWGEGYNQRFGLTYVDFATQKRTIKDSGLWYGKLAASGVLTV